MKTVIATGKFLVSFNAMLGGYCVGDPDCPTTDFGGDDVDELVAEVCANMEPFRLTFKRTNGRMIVGIFLDEDGDAYGLMIREEYFWSSPFLYDDSRR